MFRSVRKADDLIWGAVQNSAELFKRQHGDVAVLLQRIQRMVINAAPQELILRNISILHGRPERAVVDHRCLPTFF